MRRINLDARDLEAVLALAECGSFRGAAERLGLSQPTVSVRIRKVEDILGIVLFERTTRRVRPTQAGERLRERAAQTVSQLRTLLAEFEEEATLKRGRVRLGASFTVAGSIVPAVVARFCAQWPNIEVLLVDDFAGRELNRLLAGEVDFAIAAPSPDERLVEFEKLLDDDFVVIVAAGHPLASAHTVRLKEAADYPLLTFPAKSASWQAFTEAFTAAGSTFSPRFQMTSVSTIIAMIRAGLGISLLPRLALTQYNLEGICVLRVAEKLQRQVGIVTVPGRTLSVAAAALLKAFRSIKEDAPLPSSSSVKRPGRSKRA